MEISNELRRLVDPNGKCCCEYCLINKCKEWAMNKGYQIISGPSDESSYRPQDERAYSKVLWYEGDDIHREYKDMYFMANTEVEAVIKASEYVFKAISNK